MAAFADLWPESLGIILEGVVLWTAGRKLLGRRSGFRALVLMFIGAAVTWWS